MSDHEQPASVYRAGHLGVSLLVVLPVTVALVLVGRTDLAVLGELCVLSVASLPDVDHELPLVAHRGVTHTAWFALLVGIGFGAVGWVLGGRPATPAAPELAAAGVVFGALGICAHLLGDVLTPMGITPLWPLSGRTVTFDLVRAKNPIANYGLLGLGVFATVSALLVVTPV
ncbi:inner membrane protein [Halorientalis persicus]|jgi:inner membrane protein|uniref:Inner membrane protein n=1 Tax=Halorientalis persicus TaxID=1367881 RepID=A0A1H8QXT4_9EURY|nr:metal-dependent hydrolase [Halorientalis persicus]SEO58694.1 inner membrane protein [Halorientalis persicus]